MGFFKKIFSSPIFKVAAPLALSFTPAGPLLGAALGATGTAASALGGGLLGAGLGAATGGGLKGAAIGGASGALGGAFKGAGGITGLANEAGFGNAAYSALDAADNGGLWSGLGNGLSGIGSSILGGADKLTGGLSTAGSTSGLGSALTSGNLLNLGANVFSGIQGTKAYKDISKAQMGANDLALDATRPFLSSGVAANTRLSSLLGLGGEDNPDDILNMLRNSPGYKFRMEQGQDALNKSLSARGGLFSGEAIKASQELGQGIADQTYNDYVGDLYRQSQAGQTAAGTMGSLYQDGGNIQANGIMGKTNVLNSSLAGALNGNFNPTGNKKLIGYDPKTGQPVYG